MHAKHHGAVRLIRSIRGEGTLLWGAQGARAVTYAIDVFRQGQMSTASGDVRGDLANLVSRVPANVRLRFADGAEVSASLADIEADGAMIELLGPAPGG
jgi:hypothetical protein